MEERKMLAVLALIQAVQCATGMFFHEPSNVVIQPEEPENGSDFGFAMAYRNDYKTLIVGAPKADFVGKVFKCVIENANVYQNISCGEKNMDIIPSDYINEKFPEQHFHLGATIVATNESFFTCAPLWTTQINANGKTGELEVTDAFGTCFVHNDNHETLRYQGLLEYYEKSRERKKGFKPISTRSEIVETFTGGTGWSTLLDEENDLLLIAKTSLSGDFFYLHASNPTEDVKSLAEKQFYQNYLPTFWNIGFGLAAGKFFSGKTVYAFSMLQKNMEGIISFLGRKYDGSLSMLARNRADETHQKFIKLHSHAVGTMFGTTMSAADLNLDGLDELLVGAPAQSEDECFECGALHIYIGATGDMRTINDAKRHRSIFASVWFGRFGTAIAAKDIDGDGKPEIVVSAPYEKSGKGAIYILSGYEVYNTLMKSQDYKGIQLSDLKLTQRIHKESYRTLGFSLQFVDDVDDNGCDELAASATGSSKVLLFKCVQKINVTLSSKLIGEQIVREQDKFFTVEVCARVQMPELPIDMIGNITIENSIIGEAAILQQPNIVIDMSCYTCHKNRNLCENVTVELTDKDPRYYTFKSTAQIQNNFLSDKNMEVFNYTWVEASPYSKLNISLEVSRHCKGNDCKPDLSMKLLWSGSNPYLLGSTANETVTIKVQNQGNASYSACVWLRVTGAPLSRVDCESHEEGYRCYLPKPLGRLTETSIDLKLNMTKPTNVAENLLVEVILYETCNHKIDNSTMNLTVPFELNSESVFSVGDTHKLNYTDKQILENATVYDQHEYQIWNNGSITWKNVNFSVEMPMKPYINYFKILATDFGNCKRSNLTSSSFIIHHCTLELLPNTMQTIIGTTEIFAGLLKGYLNGGELNISSSSLLRLSDRVPMLSAASLTEIKIQKEITLASKKWLIILIAVIVALIILAILTFVLYKCGFFRRKQKRNLLVKQESIRRKSVRRNTHASAMDGPMEGLQIDVVDDCPFEEARPVTTKDNVGLVVDEEPDDIDFENSGHRTINPLKK